MIKNAISKMLPNPPKQKYIIKAINFIVTDDNLG